MSFGWVGSGSECMNGHFKMESPKTSFHDINPHLMHLFHPQISTQSRMFRTNSSAWGRVWNCVAPEKGMNVKTLITHPHAHARTHTHTHSLQSSSARASPFCPHCLTWSYSAPWTQHVSWKDRRSQLTHCGPLLTNHLYHTALQGYQRENTGQPFAQTRGLTNNLLTCWEIFKNYIQLPCWLQFFLTYNLFVKNAKLLVFCVTPIMLRSRNWMQCNHPR